MKKGILALILSSACHGEAGLPGDWQIRETPVTTLLTAAASAPGQLIAVGQAGTILVSGNGSAWDSVPYDGSGDFLCLTFAKGLYVAGGTFGCMLAISPDGLNWTTLSTTLGQHAIFDVTYGGARFVAVGRGGVFNPTLISTSTNGINWQPVNVPSSTNSLRAVAFGNGKYVAVGERGTILTSTNATNWTFQISGTEHLLRSVIFTGREFLAGGDSSILLTSGDGISWVTVPFSSFDVRKLATSGTAVVAVGGLGTEGRLQASTNGVSWSAPAETFASRLNGVMHFGFGKFFAVGNNGLIVESGAVANAPVNVWTKNTNGYWHEGPWSLGHMPSWADTKIVFTNAGSKTLEINATTTRDYPESLCIRELALFWQPEDATNTLLLNNTGWETPLKIDNGLRVPPNFALRSFNSALEGSGMELSGDATFSDTHLWFRGSINVGVIGPANVAQTNGYLAASGLGIGGNRPGTWSQHGGTNETRGLGIGPGSAYDLYGGVLNIQDSLYNSITVGRAGFSNYAVLRIHGGVVTASGPVVFSEGELTLDNGLLESSVLAGQNYTVTQTGGTNKTARLELPTFSRPGRAKYVLSNGTLESGLIRLGFAADSSTTNFGEFIQNGGVHIASSLELYSRERDGMPIVQSTYALAGGVLMADGMFDAGGEFTQTGGTNQSGYLSVSTYRLVDGWLITSNTAVNPGMQHYPGRFTQTGGRHRVREGLHLFGIYAMQGGTLIPDKAILYGELQLTGGEVWSDMIAFSGGVLTATGTYELGPIMLNWEGGRIDFLSGQTVLRFAESFRFLWSTQGVLTVTNWTRDIDRLFIGHNQAGLTAAQLSRIQFVNPSGFSPGIYSARMTSTGEVVPVPRIINYQHSANQLVLTWPEGYRLLTATNVAGPYSLITNAISPYTASYHTDPQRFFIIRNEN